MSETLPADQIQTAQLRCVVPPGMARSTFTGLIRFEFVKNHLSSRALRRPQRLQPLRVISHAELVRIADKNPPPSEWLEGEEECPFVIE